MNATQRTSTAAIISLVFGIVSWIALPLLGALVAIVAGHMARAEIRRERIDGDNLALIGLVLGYLNIGLTILLFLAVVFGVLSLGVLAALGGAG
ncbi:DUF4190 domain-containing protein [Pseudomarimonas salicorniae]|uniref:DUF4190 domain-containing protein n=1 Tax=Pseudomarimonas salicorniae TaxID=2933270 RepID=A0ABT0GF20_9GAMM|nr:DUF4190 domain-containing protein [Lysobacter sp. CAU 1642]MCK7593140.1 DUF4190 domain-containing protein [Lysobacter sp. CAU 1642]